MSAGRDRPLIQVKTFFEKKEEIDETVNIFLADLSRKNGLRRDDFEDSWTVYNMNGVIYCFVRIYYRVKIPAD